MPTKDSLTSKIKNLARGGENYRHLRWRVNKAILERQHETTESISPFLRRTLFSLERRRTASDNSISPLEALPFLDRDWQILSRMLGNRSRTLDSIYLRLAADYIIENRLAVARLFKAERAIAAPVFALDGQGIQRIFDDVGPTDRQSLFAFRLYAAFNRLSRQSIADYFVKNSHSDWVRQTLLYPLIYHALNLPSERDFSHVIEQMFPTSQYVDVERNAVTFVLRGGFEKGFSLAFKCYIGLTSHPFDALEMITSHVEEAVISQVCPNDADLAVLREVAIATESSRLDAVLRAVTGPVYGYASAVSQLPLSSRLDLSPSDQAFFEAFISTDSIPPVVSEDRGLLSALQRLRWRRYPTLSDFGDIVGNAQQYAFCEVGRFLDVILTSIYMVERSSVKIELRNLQRQLDYFGAVTPYTVCSPRGALALYQGVFGRRDEIEGKVDADIVAIDLDVSSRWWIKKLHWSLRVFERDMKVAQWLKVVRSSVPLSGNSRFLSGVDWKWVDQVTQALRIRPFAGNPDGIYVLLLRAIETRQREPNTLKLALAPKIPQGGSLSDAVKWLFVEYGKNTLAFIRHFLTPQMIMKMKLEANYTAALSERLNALDMAVGKFGLDGEILTEVQYEHESKALITALTYMTIGAAQFEVPWDAFQADGEVSAQEDYTAFEAFNKTYNSLSVLSKASRTISHVYSNKQLGSYELQNKDLPLVTTIAHIIDVFLSNPSYGIEAILAIRIRHDTLRREFATLIAEHRRANVTYVPVKEKMVCIDAIEPVLMDVIRGWVDKYMHTPRGSSHGLFDFVPSGEEMHRIVKQAARANDLQEVVAVVSRWVQAKLSLNLMLARSKLTDDLKPALVSAIRYTTQALVGGLKVGAASAASVSAVLEHSVTMRCDELLAWFEFPKEVRKVGLTYSEIEAAAEGKFIEEILAGSLVINLYAPELGFSMVTPAHIRPLFDIWSEIVTNALKHGSVTHAKIRITEFRTDAFIGLRFSSRCAKGNRESWAFTGEPKKVKDVVLLSGKSGHEKIAALSASVIDGTSTVHVERRQGSFHVFVPLKALNRVCS